MSMMDRVHAQGAGLDLAALNSVPVTVADLSEARFSDPVSSARLQALERWVAENDPDRVIDRAHLLDAAALATLTDSGDGVGFDAAHFGELVEFVAELPW